MEMYTGGSKYYNEATGKRWNPITGLWEGGDAVTPLQNPTTPALPERVSIGGQSGNPNIDMTTGKPLTPEQLTLRQAKQVINPITPTPQNITPANNNMTKYPQGKRMGFRNPKYPGVM